MSTIKNLFKTKTGLLNQWSGLTVKRNKCRSDLQNAIDNFHSNTEIENLVSQHRRINDEIRQIDIQLAEIDTAIKAA